jgi:selenocysteine lyase/cysteine desulfurase
MTDQNTPLGCQRDLFDVPEGMVYLAAASKSTIPRATVAAGKKGVETKAYPWALDEEARHDQTEDIRARFGALIGATADDIAIHPSAAYGTATAAKNMSLPKGSRVIVIEGQFPSNVYVWDNLARKSGAEVFQVKRPDDYNWTRDILAAIDERTSLVALPPVHWTDGTLVDLLPISAAIKDVGAQFVVDATQWTGAQPIDVQALGIDYMVNAAYKWLMGPYGLSFMYFRPDHQNGDPIENHTHNHLGGNAGLDLLGNPSEFTPASRRFDVGEFENFISLPMIQASLQQIDAWGPTRVGDYLRTLTDAVADGAGTLGLETPPASARCPHFIGLRHNDGFAPDILEQLAKLDVHVSVRGGGLRISPHMLNDKADIDLFFERLETVIKR